MSNGFLPWLSSVLLLLGALIGLIGAIGVLRLPDSYTRMHAASKAGALGTALILAGVAAASEGAFALAALFAMAILLATAPLAAHAMARAAHRAGITPATGPLGDALAAEDGSGHTEGNPGASAPPTAGKR
ncbi:monovalent cation/H(+) antiporter subunit G [Thauera sp. ZXT1-4]|uniref:monovalent cation/H(+) antiporter subunit G n=1 Tax=Thauera sp. ZXT1-4 TaxID=3460294 RepID=UPI0040408551